MFGWLTRAMARASLSRRRWRESRVEVRSEVGAITGVIAKAYDRIRAGNVLMYYPEANTLVPRRVDPQSGTPAFKNVLVAITPVAVGLDASRAAQSSLVMTGQAQATSTRRSMRSC